MYSATERLSLELGDDCQRHGRRQHEAEFSEKDDLPPDLSRITFHRINMLHANLPAWRYAVLLLSCVAAFVSGYLNAIDYKKPLTKTQRIMNSVSVWTLIALLAVVQTSTNFYTDPSMDTMQYMD